ncbi:aldo/keto reductase [Pedobacter sp.]|uniref:aldo/keto reductase n=1 Tax=Pedobacter sp. TaxID=1411316 RepID=UPI00396C4BF0
MKKLLGNTDLEVSQIAFGGNVFGWTIGEKESFELLNIYVGKGHNFIDTADVYSTWKPGNKGGESETIIGNWLKKHKNRDSIIIATKVGGIMSNDRKGLSSKYIIEAVEDSLQRLSTDYIDLYQSHYDDMNTPIEETLNAYEHLIKAGKVRWIGASNFSKERLILSLQTSVENNLPTYQSLQPEYNLYDRENYERDFEQTCLKYNLGVITYFSLAAGFLTGKYYKGVDPEKSERGNRMKKYLNERGARIINGLTSIAQEYQVTEATIAIAWLISKKSITSAITSATNPAQLNELLKATELSLSAENMAYLDEVSRY